MLTSEVRWDLVLLSAPSLRSAYAFYTPVLQGAENQRVSEVRQ